MVDVKIEHKVTLGERASSGPALGVHNNALWMAWTGDGNNQLNVVQVVLRADGSLNVDLSKKQIMGDSSDRTPALASYKGRLWIAWVGVNNRQLNVMGSLNGHDFDTRTRQILSQTTDDRVVIAPFRNALFMGWTGRGNGEMNVIRSVNGNDFDLGTIKIFPGLIGSMTGLCVYRDQLRMLWVDRGSNLNVMSTVNDHDFDPGNKFTLPSQPGTWFNADCVLDNKMWGASAFHAFRTTVEPMHVSRVIFVPEINRWGQESVQIALPDSGLPSIASFQNKLVMAWLGDDNPKSSQSRLYRTVRSGAGRCRRAGGACVSTRILIS